MRERLVIDAGRKREQATSKQAEATTSIIVWVFVVRARKDPSALCGCLPQSSSGSYLLTFQLLSLTNLFSFFLSFFLSFFSFLFFFLPFKKEAKAMSGVGNEGRSNEGRTGFFNKFKGRLAGSSSSMSGGSAQSSQQGKPLKKIGRAHLLT